MADVIHIGPASTADAGELLTLQRAAWLSEGRDHDTFDIPPLTQTLDELRAELPHHTVLVARDRGRIVGTVRAKQDGTRWRIGRLGVVPDRTGTGLGSRLLAAIEHAAPPDVDRYELFTGPRSEGNHAFYARRGYSRLETSDDAEVRAAAARGVDLVAFAKPASPGTGQVDVAPTRIDHVGLAVPDLEAAIAFWGETFGADCVVRETNDDQRVLEAMLVLGDGVTQIQLLAPMSPESTIGRFLERHGSGVQHLAVTVTDVQATAAELRAKGLRLIYETPRPGTAGSRVNFVHPKDTGGVLVELVQPAG